MSLTAGAPGRPGIMLGLRSRGSWESLSDPSVDPAGGDAVRRRPKVKDGAPVGTEPLAAVEQTDGPEGEELAALKLAKELSDAGDELPSGVGFARRGGVTATPLPDGEGQAG